MKSENMESWPAGLAAQSTRTLTGVVEKDLWRFGAVSRPVYLDANGSDGEIFVEIRGCQAMNIVGGM